MISIQARMLVKVSIIMIATRSIKIENVTVEQNTVAATMFGANTLQSVNTSDSGIPFAQYETAITVAGSSYSTTAVGTAGATVDGIRRGASATAVRRLRTGARRQRSSAAAGALGRGGRSNARQHAPERQWWRSLRAHRVYGG